jgi:hypothetical protein
MRSFGDRVGERPAMSGMSGYRGHAGTSGKHWQKGCARVVRDMRRRRWCWRIRFGRVARAEIEDEANEMRSLAEKTFHLLLLQAMLFI